MKMRGETAQHSTSVNSPIFDLDTQGNFCSVALLFLKSIAKLKFKNIPGDKRMKDRAQFEWVSETCRNIQIQVIKTSAFNNHLALKDSFGMDYSKLFPGSIFNPLYHIRRTFYHLLRAPLILSCE